MNKYPLNDSGTKVAIAMNLMQKKAINISNCMSCFVTLPLKVN
jgi:hypothetical protein